MTRFVIGIDGGGTGCRVLIRDDLTGKTARAEGGPSNVATDFSAAISNVQEALETAAATLGVKPDLLHDAKAHIGLAGVYDPGMAAQTKAKFRFDRLSVSDDRPGAVEGFLGGQDGYLVAAGTGMIVGSARAGVYRFVGGHGFQISDHGSGAWIGRRVLDLSLRCHDGVFAQSDLTRTTLAEFGSDPNEVVAFSMTAGPADYAKLAPRVVEAAQSGDAHGVAILEAGAAHISDGLKALGFKPGHRLCLAGGVGPHYVTYFDMDVTQGLVIPDATALDGAFRLAEKLEPER